jgi:hypothetical protein
VAGTLALVTIATFWLSTALTELFASQTIVTLVKTAIPWGFLLLIPALMAAGGSGFALTKKRRGAAIEGAAACMNAPRRHWRSREDSNFRPTV